MEHVCVLRDVSAPGLELPVCLEGSSVLLLQP